MIYFLPQYPPKLFFHPEYGGLNVKGITTGDYAVFICKNHVINYMSLFFLRVGTAPTAVGSPRGEGRYRIGKEGCCLPFGDPQGRDCPGALVVAHTR